jgi:hypothetical protein
LTAIARPATVGRWCDFSAKPTSTQLRILKAEGYTGVMRYVPLPSNNPAHDIDSDELGAILDLGLELLLVQHVRTPPWDPRSHSGVVDGAAAAEHARAVGYSDAHIFLDLEGITPGTDAAGVIQYANAWADRVLQSGFRAGLYVGYDVPLSPEQLYQELVVNSYWKDAGPRDVATRGFAVQQLSPEKTVAGLRIDEDVVVTDLLGEVPYACVSG